MRLLLVLAVLVGTLLAGLRWLRVTQREHYLTGGCTRTLGRWIETRPPNRLSALFVLMGLIAVVAAELGNSRWVDGLAVGTLVSASLLPYGMSVLGRTHRLRPTRRLLLLASVAFALSLGLAMAVGQLIGRSAAATVAVAAIPFSVDAGSWLVAPIERRISRRWRRRAMERLARVRPRIVAITGSYGKTSTKEHLRDLLEGAYHVVASPASWNNEAGLSRAINEKLAAGTEVFIAEMGTYGRGEIRELCSWLPPEIAIITAIGPVHLERMRTLDTIVAAKSEILEHAPIAVLAVDDPQLASLASRFEEGAGTLWRVQTSEDPPGQSIPRTVVLARGGQGELVVYTSARCLGTVAGGTVHPVNVGCAVAAALALGTPEKHISSRLPRLASSRHRAEVQSHNGLLFIDNTYNSNPVGATEALRLLGQSVPSGRRVVITPGMVELGAEQERANRQLAEAVVESGATLVIVGWTNRKPLLDGARHQAICVDNRDAARQWLRSHLGPGDGVLWENDLPDHYP